MQSRFLLFFFCLYAFGLVHCISLCFSVSSSVRLLPTFRVFVLSHSICTSSLLLFVIMHRERMELNKTTEMEVALAIARPH